MPQYPVRANLQNANFPMLSGQFGRSVINNPLDETWIRNANQLSNTGFSGVYADAAMGIPQIFFAQNVVPTAYGVASVSFYADTNAMVPAQTDFDKVFTLRALDDSRILFSPGQGKNYIFSRNAISNNWASFKFDGVSYGGVPYPQVGLVTVANCRLQSYIYYANIGCFQYDVVANAFNVVALTALVAANIKGLCGASNYLIAWDDSHIYNSSATTPTDFTPSLITGAGVITPTSLRGSILGCIPLADGFIICTTVNMVAAIATGNIKVPFIYREIDNSAGIPDMGQISFDNDSSTQYAYTTGGLVNLNKSSSMPIAPEVSDFIAGKTIESWNAVTGITKTTSAADLYVKCTYIGERFLILSYGINKGALTHALMFDISFKRWGKVKIDHVACFEYASPLQYINSGKFSDYPATPFNGLPGQKFSDFRTLTASTLHHGSNVGFLQKDGTVRVLNIFGIGTTTDACIMLGRFQLSRVQMVALETIELETTSALAPSVRHFYTIDGRTQLNNGVLLPNLVANNELFVYKLHTTGKNHTIELSGNFMLNTAQFTFVQSGLR